MANGEEKHKRVLTITANMNMNTLFVDMIQVQSNPENIVLNLLQFLPDDLEGSPDNPQAKLVGRFALTWPHFARLVGVLVNCYEQQKDSAKKALEHLPETTFLQKSEV